MGLDFGAVGAISGLSAQKFAQAMALQQNAQSSPEALARTALYGHQGGLFDSEAGLNTVRAGLMPQQTAADIAEATARTGLTNVQAQQLPLVDKSIIASNYGRAASDVAQGRLSGQQAVGIGQENMRLDQAIKDPNNPLSRAILNRAYGSLAMGYPGGSAMGPGWWNQPVTQTTPSVNSANGYGITDGPTSRPVNGYGLADNRL